MAQGSNITGHHDDEPGLPGPNTLAIWAASAGHLTLDAAVRCADLDPIAVGSDEEACRRALLAERDVPSFDDPRVGPQEAGAGCLVAADCRFDPAPHLRAGRVVATTEPLGPLPATDPRPPLLGEFVRAPGFRAVEQILESFGPVASVHVECHCAPGQGSLHGRLHDALRVLERLCGDMEMVDAMLVGSNAAQSVEPVHSHVSATPDELIDLTGTIGALVRHIPRSSSTISVSDHSGWRRSVRILGAGGTLECGEVGVNWIDPVGRVIEHQALSEDPFGDACAHLASELGTLLEAPDRLGAAEPVVVTHAACEAVRLSCRTRAPESPEKIRDLLERT